MQTTVRRRARAWLAASLTTALAAVGAVLIVTPPAAAAPVDLSRGKPVTASSSENPTYYPPNAAVDGDPGTRWSSEFSDPQWLQVDLERTATLDHLVLQWEGAYGRAFTVRVADAPDGPWRTAATVTDGAGGTQTVPATGVGRYVRLDLTERGTGYGYSLWDLAVFGTPGGATDPDPDPGPGGCGATNVALGRPATASSSEWGGSSAAAAVDGDLGTRFASAFADDQWWQVDLGERVDVCAVVLHWEGAHARAFRVQVADQATGPWTTVHTVANGTGGVQELAVAGTGRYVRLALDQRATGYGFSLWEVAVHAGDGGTTDPGDVIPGGGELGPNVHVFTPADSQATVQAKLDEIFTAQEEAQFGERRDQILFAPGEYDVHAHIGFNTSINGLGRNPTDVEITGGVWADALWFGGNATQNFWRSAENLTITPRWGEARWAVSQAAPFRRIQVNGNLNLAPSGFGWASGGFIADSRVTGQVASYSQQQWFNRDSTFGSWSGSVWNMVFSGVQGDPAPSFPNPSHTVRTTTPAVAEKPYLYLDGDDYAVFVPALRHDARGITWANGATPGRSIPLAEFYVAHPGDSADRINAALAQGLHLLLTPGIYDLDRTIEVTRANTVVLGLGYATITPVAGQTAMRVADVPGVKIAAVLFDAGVLESPAMLEVGVAGVHTDHAANPITLHDVFVRVGGRIPGKVDTAIVVHADDTIVDHVWSWRGDHGDGIGWDLNTADYGFVVNGDDVKAYGLFVEHYQKENTLWNGERGLTVFYQCELPYDVPDQAAWQNGPHRGYAGYRVADHVTAHQGYGMGVYSYFNVDPTITVDRGFQVPERPGIVMRNLATVSLGGHGIIAHVINDTGGTAQGTATIPAYVVSFP